MGYPLDYGVAREFGFMDIPAVTRSPTAPYLLSSSWHPFLQPRQNASISPLPPTWLPLIRLMVINSRTFNLGSKPIARFISAFTAAFLLFLVLKGHPLFPNADSSGVLTSLQHHECANDRVLPKALQGGLTPESTIGKVTIIYNGKDPTFVRALQSHAVHNNRHGYPLQILRHGILDGLWSKPAYILAVLLEEMRKSERFRLQWLLYVT